MSAVIDASVVLAWLQAEPRSDIAERHMVEGIIGAANWSEAAEGAATRSGPRLILVR